MKVLHVYTDGGARGNPGPAAIGVVFIGENKEIGQISKTIGVATNNVAEYRAVLEGFSWLISNFKQIGGYEKIHFFLDSQLVVSQLNGLFKVKNANLRDLLFKIREKEAELSKEVFYSHIPREKNRIADKLVNKALDNDLFPA